MQEYLATRGLGFASDTGISIQKGYRDTITKLLNDGYRVVQLAPTPMFKQSVRQSILNHIKKHIKEKNDLSGLSETRLARLLSFPTSKFDNKSAGAMKLLGSIKGSKYHLIFPHKLFCDTIIKGRCVSNNGKLLYFLDKIHPSQDGAEMIANMIAGELIK